MYPKNCPDPSVPIGLTVSDTPPNVIVGGVASLAPSSTIRTLLEPPAGTLYEIESETVLTAWCKVSGSASMMDGEVVARTAGVVLPSAVSSPSIEEVKYEGDPYRFCDPVLLSL